MRVEGEHKKREWRGGKEGGCGRGEEEVDPKK